jgi:hypothetical protein
MARTVRMILLAKTVCQYGDVQTGEASAIHFGHFPATGLSRNSGTSPLAVLALASERREASFAGARKGKRQP